MLTIIHGENHTQSRKKLVDLLDQAKNSDSEIIQVEAKELSLAKLETAISSNNLFNDKKLLIIDSLHSLPRSKKKDSFLNLISESNQIDIILWEKKQLTKTNLKKFPDAQVFEFKVSQKLWSFLDKLSPIKSEKKKQLELLDEVVKKDDPIFCIAMILRQIRMMIKSKEGAPLKGAPFMIAKTKKQAHKFSMDQLLDLHQKIADLDRKIKNSENLLDLKAELDLLIINM